MIDIIPGILEKDFAEIERRIALVAPYVSWVQIDVADNTLVPNETFLDFGKFAKLVQLDKNPSLEAHLMVAEPEKYIRPLADAGFKRLIAHVEAHDPRRFLDGAKYESVEVGLAIDGPTDIEQIEPFLEEIDVVLVMTIEAGFSGQALMPETIDKIKKIHENFPDLAVEVDGGINDKTAKLVRDAGATRLVSTSYLFKDPAAIAQAIERLKDA
ncbi:ribulose-phosphate 3-epimerase [Candidatus Gottesmanbacteria bacterium]|nr:ribulose-phosphate 3-epimerase [Candidatus Gottesmanbacteria bacterium]